MQKRDGYVLRWTAHNSVLFSSIQTNRRARRLLIKGILWVLPHLQRQSRSSLTENKQNNNTAGTIWCFIMQLIALDAAC